MSSIGSPNPLLFGGATSYEIKRSLRFNSTDSPYLTRTPSSSGNRSTMTWSFWYKRGKLGSEYVITAFNGTNTDRIAFASDDQLHIELKNGNATEAELHSTRLFRDPSAWYHIVIAFDTTNSTTADRCKAYVNNERITEWDTNDTISQNYVLSGFNTASKVNDIGAYSGSGGSRSGHCNGYMAELIFIDGQQLTPSSFAETHEKTGQWVPKKTVITSPNDGTTWSSSGADPHSLLNSGTYANVFDGDISNALTVDQDATNYITLCDGVSISCANTFGFMSNSGSSTNTLRINGSTTLAQTASGTVWTDGSFTGTITKIEFGYLAGSGSSSNIYGVRVDGVQLLDGAGTHGKNGFHLNFSANSGTTATTLGKDSFSNGNNWTPNGFSVATGIGNDSLEDTPTNNFCTLNTLGSGIDGSGCDISQGGLYVARNSGSNRFMDSTFTLSSGKWYWEAKTGSSISDYPRIGIWNRGGYQNRLNYPGEGNSGVASDDHVRGWGANGTSFGASGDSASGLPTFSTSEVLMFAMDMDSGKIWFGKDGTWYTDDNSTTTTAAAIAAGTATPKFADLKSGAETQFRQSEKGWTPIAHMNSGDTWEFNFGSRPFAHTPPAGFNSICTKNLPEPAIIKPSDYFKTVLYTGQNTSDLYNVTGVGFQPDLVWGKSRNDTIDHILFDSVRGDDKQLSSDNNAAEVVRSSAAYRFLSDGFAVSTVGNMNNPVNYVAWNWKKSVTAGFDIVTYTGDGSDGTSISHSLGVKPDLISVKRRDGSGYWVTECPHTHNGRGMHWDLDNGSWNAGTNTITLNTSNFTFANSGDSNRKVNFNGETYVAYLWASIPGFSKIYGYSGNGNADGEFIYTGFRPAYVVYKATDEAYWWIIHDTGRDPDNVVKTRTWINATNTENDSGAYADFCANGIKFRTSDAGNNSTNINHIVIAFAAQTLKYANAH